MIVDGREQTARSPGPPVTFVRWKPESWTLLVAAGVAVVAGAFALAGRPEDTRLVLTVFGSVAGVLLAARVVSQMIRGHFGVDLLAVVAIAATVLTGEVVATLIIVIMVSGGSVLEDVAGRRAERELDALIDRQPRVAHQVVDGAVREVRVEEVRVGDEVLVRAGDVVPVDGALLTARAEFDESALTGESLPVERMAGDVISSGSVNGPRAVTLTTVRLAADSQYQAIVSLVKSASANRAPMVRLADRFAVPFTLVSLTIAGTAWWLSGDPVRFAEVVVLATPCPLLLAAPVGFMAGMGRAARNGIVVKGGAVLETLSRVRAVVVDKTGTLTAGHPTVVRLDVAAGRTPDELLALVAAVETLSSHVLATSIVSAARDRGLMIATATHAEEVEARGISAYVDGRRVSVGTAAFIGEAVGSTPATPVHGGELAIYVAVDGDFAGTVVASDPVRPEAADTVRLIRQLGIDEVIMLTGDAGSTARHVASMVGIDVVHADCLPVDKVDLVRSLTTRPVLMIGDGINDAPVLAVADVGVAMGARGATSASEAAGAVILSDDLARVVRVLAISRDTVRIVYQSIWVGVSVSVVLMVVAAFGFIPAVLGATLQEGVDLISVLNALRALRDRQAWEGPDAVRGTANAATVARSGS